MACDTVGDKGGARETCGVAEGAAREAAAAFSKGGHVGATAGHGSGEGEETGGRETNKG